MICVLPFKLSSSLSVLTFLQAVKDMYYAKD